MLEQVLMHLNNWFCDSQYYGTFSVIGGLIEVPELQNDQYYRVVGSVFNDGVYRYGLDTLPADETFTGEIWALKLPPTFLSLVEEINTWQKKNGAANGPYQSEAFGGYSYTLRSSSEGEDGTTWEGAFRKRLNVWRKL